MSKTRPAWLIKGVAVIGEHKLRLLFEDGTVGDVSFQNDPGTACSRRSRIPPGPVTPQVRLRVEQQLWFSAGRTGLTRSRVLSLHFASSAARRAWERDGRPSYSTSPQRIATLGANRYLLGDLELSRRQVLTFTTDPDKLYQRLYAAGGSAYEVFVEIGDQLRNRPTPAPLRAALYRALALVPGITLVGATLDRPPRRSGRVHRSRHGGRADL